MKLRKTFQEVVQELERGLRDGSIVLASEVENKPNRVLYEAILVEPAESGRPYSIRDEYITNMAGICLIATLAKGLVRQLAHELSGIGRYTGKVKIKLITTNIHLRELQR